MPRRDPKSTATTGGLPSVHVDPGSQSSAAARASVHIRELIFTGVLRPGDRLDQDEVSVALGVSRQPVREAVLEIATDGLLVVRPRHGVFVGQFSQKTVRDHFELYGYLRGYAAARVASSRDARTVARLAELQRAAERSNDIEEIDRIVAEFFRTINVASDNLRLRIVLRAMTRFVPGNFFDRFPKAIPHARRGCRRILRALEDHDPAQASLECERMWREGGEFVIEALQASGVLGADDLSSEVG
jgi:DNA-binding GntR family transcriptional regulator